MSKQVAEKSTNQTYFQGPLLTLHASLSNQDGSIALHDLQEAYAILSARLRAVTNGRGVLDSPGIKTLKQHRSHLIRALCRDIRRISCDPLEGRNGATIEEITRVCRENESLTISALSLVSDILRFTPATPIFSSKDLSPLLDATLDIAAQSFPPTPNASQVRCLTLSVIRTQQLSDVALTPFLQRICTIFETILQNTDGPSSNNFSLLVLQALQEQLLRFPAAFLGPFIRLLPHVLKLLTSAGVNISSQACFTICYYARAFLANSSDLEVQRHAAKIITQYLREERRKRTTQVPTFIDAVHTCLAMKEPKAFVNSPAWATATIASMVILAGPFMFDKSDLLVFAFNSALSLKTCPDHSARELAIILWRTFVWAYGRLPLGAALMVTSFPSIEENCFMTIKQERDGDVSTCLIATILREGNAPQRVKQIVRILDDMILDGPRLREHAKIVLHALIRGVLGHTVNTDLHCLMPRCILSKSMLEECWTHPGELVEEAGRVTAKCIKPLSNEEMRSEWDAFLGLWMKLTGFCVYGNKGGLTKELLETWHAVLVIQTQPGPVGVDLEVVPDAAAKVTEALSSLLVNQHDADHDKSDTIGLEVVLRLWSTMKSIFSTAYLSQFARSVLAKVLRKMYNLADVQVKEAWTTLCADLVSVGAPDIVRSLWQVPKEDQQPELQKQIWNISVSHCISVHAAGYTDDMMIALFAGPIRRWLLDDAQCIHWQTLLDLHADKRVTSGRDLLSVLDQVIDAIRDVRDEPFSLNVLRAASAILTCLTRRTYESEAVQALQFIRDVLLSSYADESRQIRLSMEIMARLHDFMRVKGSASLLATLEVLQDGLVQWIQDEQSIVPEADYNEIVVPLYCDILEHIKSLGRLEHTILEALINLFLAAFERSPLPSPAEGPLSFCRFWAEVEPTPEAISHPFMEQIRDTMFSARDAWTTNVTVPDWMGTDSQLHEEISLSIQHDVPEPRVIRGEEQAASPLRPESVLHGSRGEKTPTRGSKRMRRTTPVKAGPSAGPSSVSEPSSQVLVERTTIGPGSMSFLSTPGPSSFACGRELVETPGSSSSRSLSSHQIRSFSQPIRQVLVESRHAKRRKLGHGGIKLSPRHPPLVQYMEAAAESAEGEQSQVDEAPSSTPRGHPAISPKPPSTAASGRADHRDRSEHDVSFGEPDDGEESIWEQQLTLSPLRELRRESRIHEEDMIVESSEPEDSDTSFDLLSQRQEILAPLEPNSPVGSQSEFKDALRDISHVMRSEERRPASRTHSAPGIFSGPSHPATGSSHPLPFARPPLRRANTAVPTPLTAAQQLRDVVSTSLQEMQTQDLAQAAQAVHEVAGILNTRMAEKLRKERNH